jgi:hypothetical protein
MKRPRPKQSRLLPRPLEIPGIMDLLTLADLRKLLGHLPEVTRARDTWPPTEAAYQAGTPINSIGTPMISKCSHSVHSKVKRSLVSVSGSIPNSRIS